MSKVKAYRCDYCGQIKEDAAITGISTAADLFDNLKSYPIIKNNDKADVHGCTDCYSFLMRDVDSINKRKYEDIYIKKRDEMGYMFRSGCVSNARTGNYTPPKVIEYKALK